MTARALPAAVGRRTAAAVPRRAGGAAASPPERAGAPAAGERPHVALRAVGVAAWAFCVQLVWLAGDLLWDKPISPLFAGDALHYLEAARHLARGEAFGAGLPFHPPLTIWLLAPLWSLLDSPAVVYMASKVLMAALGAATWAVAYLLLRHRLPLAGLACLLGPLYFGELLLSSAANSETPYRLLLALLLLLGWRWPVLGGALHAAAALTRAEHLLVIVVGTAVALCFARHRRWAAVTAGTTVLLLLPYVVAVRADLRDYNRRFAADLAGPLPEWVPISFYGPLNFALAQREEGLFFSRRTLPPGRAGQAELDPTVPEHRELIVHGYRLGWREIARRPGRFVARAAAKVVFSVRALGYGWSWRDLPKSGPWMRPPVDLAYAHEPLWLGFTLVLAAIGAWEARRDRTLLLVVAALLVYRLGVNAVFFPYLRSTMVAAPAVVALFCAGWQPLLRGGARRVVLATLVALGLFHAATAWRTRPYLLAGERDAAGVILDDRPVVIKLAEPGERR